MLVHAPLPASYAICKALRGWLYSLRCVLPAQWSELAGAAPWIVGQGEVADGAEVQASRERLKLVVVQVQ